MKVGKIKILKDENRITYIYTTEKENIPLITLENGNIIVEKQRISSPEIALLLASVLKHAVLAETSPLMEREWEELERFWAKEYEETYVRREGST